MYKVVIRQTEGFKSSCFLHVPVYRRLIYVSLIYARLLLVTLSAHTPPSCHLFIPWQSAAHTTPFLDKVWFSLPHTSFSSFLLVLTECEPRSPHTYFSLFLNMWTSLPLRLLPSFPWQSASTAVHTCSPASFDKLHLQLTFKWMLSSQTTWWGQDRTLTPLQHCIHLDQEWPVTDSNVGEICWRRQRQTVGISLTSGKILIALKTTKYNTAFFSSSWEARWSGCH